jgi:hypothetical protein
MWRLVGWKPKAWGFRFALLERMPLSPILLSAPLWYQQDCRNGVDFSNTNGGGGKVHEPLKKRRQGEIAATSRGCRHISMSVNRRSREGFASHLYYECSQEYSCCSMLITIDFNAT